MAETAQTSQKGSNGSSLVGKLEAGDSQKRCAEIQPQTSGNAAELLLIYLLLAFMGEFRKCAVLSLCSPLPPLFALCQLGEPKRHRGPFFWAMAHRRYVIGEKPQTGRSLSPFFSSFISDFKSPRRSTSTTAFTPNCTCMKVMSWRSSWAAGVRGACGDVVMNCLTDIQLPLRVAPRSVWWRQMGKRRAVKRRYFVGQNDAVTIKPKHEG